MAHIQYILTENGLIFLIVDTCNRLGIFRMRFIKTDHCDISVGRGCDLKRVLFVLQYKIGNDI